MKIPPYYRHIACAALAFSSLFTANGAEPEKILKALDLPNTPAILENFTPVFTNKAPVQTEEQAETKPSIVRKLEVKHVGGNRLLVRLEFDQIPFKGEPAASNLLYLDTDNNAETGRKDETAKGVDLLTIVSGTNTFVNRYNPALTPGNTVAQAVYDGKLLYITIETPLPESGSTIPLYGWVLSQRNQPPASNMTDRARFAVPRGTVEVLPLAPGKQATVL